MKMNANKPRPDYRPSCNFYDRCYNKPMRCRYCIRNGGTWTKGVPNTTQDYFLEPPKDLPTESLPVESPQEQMS